jgi:hypothetical protein
MEKGIKIFFKTPNLIKIDNKALERDGYFIAYYLRPNYYKDLESIIYQDGEIYEFQLYDKSK